MHFHQIIGSGGAILVVTAYFLLQIGRVSAERPPYISMNLAGSAFILYSLAFEFNFSAFLIEFFWVVISVVGAIRYLRSRRAGGS